jgi:hypothetical protein
MNFSFICHWNNKELLEKCLLSEAFTTKEDELILLDGCPNQSAAYIEGERLAKNDTLVFVHQDLVISKKYRLDLSKRIDEISKLDPKWGVIGTVGFYIDKDSNFIIIGHGESRYWKYSTQVGKLPLKVDWLDNQIFVKRKGVLAFDSNIPKFHGTVEDLCESARKERRGVWTINLYTKHHSIETNRLAEDVWECAHYLVRKWNRLLIVGSTFFWPTNKTCIINNISELMRKENGTKILPKEITKFNLPDGISAFTIDTNSRCVSSAMKQLVGIQVIMDKEGVSKHENYTKKK